MKGTSMTTATTTKPLESKETVSLIASDKVEGTAVYGTDQKKIGKLEREMIDKLGGYRASLTKDQLDKAPKYSKSTDWNWNRDNDRRVHDYYKATPYWPIP